jgi:putative glutamine amidotransferase
VSGLVAVSQRVAIDPATGERRDALDQRWAPFLQACGLTVLPLPNHPDQAMALVGQITLAGVVLSGGNDLAAYGGNAPERDETERRVVEWARRRRLPVLGVCRGAQHLAHLLGGRLERIDGHAGTRHPLAPSGREVNSYHCFAIADLPAGIDITARAADGSIEAFRLSGESVMAIMWHPEREDPPIPEDVAVFQFLFGPAS